MIAAIFGVLGFRSLVDTSCMYTQADDSLVLSIASSVANKMAYSTKHFKHMTL